MMDQKTIMWIEQWC